MNRKREYGLDFLKTVASVLIVFHHYQQDIAADYPVRFYPGPGRFSCGYMVELFFLISGFLIAAYAPRIRGGLRFRDFFLRRWLRLFPLMLLSTAGYCALYFLLGMSDSLYSWMETPTLRGFVLTSLGLQRGWGLHCPTINNPLWYLSVLLFCYILFYLLVRVSARLRFPTWVLYLLMVGIGVAFGSGEVNLPFLNWYMCRGYHSFFSGLLLAEALRGRRPGWRLAGLCVLAIAAITALIPHYAHWGLNYLITLVYLPAILLLFLSEPVSGLFRAPVFGLLGKISFDVYVWHMCALLIAIELAARELTNPAAHPMGGMLLFTVCCFLFGALSHFFLEKPCARLTDRLYGRIASS